MIKTWLRSKLTTACSKREENPTDSDTCQPDDSFDELKQTNFVKVKSDIFKQIDSILETNQLVYFYGCSGCGKTTLAREYAYSKKQEQGDDLIIKLIDSSSTFSCNLIKLKLEILQGEVQSEKEEDDLLRIIRTKINNYKQKLILIFDNVKNIDDVKKLLTNIKMSHKIIITTKNQLLFQNFSIGIEINAFDEKSCFEYLERCGIYEERLSKDQWKCLFSVGNRPNKPLSILPKSLELLVNNYNTHIRWGYEDMKKFLYNEANQRYEMLRKDNNNAYTMLSQMAFLKGSCIDLIVIKNMFREMIESNEFEATLWYLIKNTYMKQKREKDLDTTIFEIHETIQTEIRGILSEACNEALKMEILRKMAKVLNKMTINDISNWKTINRKELVRINEHANELNEENVTNEYINKDYFNLLLKLARINRKILYDNSASLNCLKKIVNIQKRTLNPNDSLIAYAMQEIGRIYKDQRKYDKALRYLNESLVIFQQKMASNDPSISVTLYEIGRVYKDQRKFDEALECFNKSLAIDKQVLSPNDSSIAYTIQEIGRVYKDQRKFDESLKCFNESLEIKKQTLSPNDPSISVTLYEIGRVYKDQRKFDEALEFFNKSLEIDKQKLSPNDPSIAYTLQEIGRVYKDQRKFDESLKCFSESLDIKKQTLSPNDPSIANTLHEIGRVYKDQRKFDEALKIFKQALKIAKQTLSPNDPLISGVYFNLGSLYLAKCSLDQALKYFQDSFEIDRQSRNHPHLLARTSDLMAKVYILKKKFDVAFELANEAFQIYNSTLFLNPIWIGDNLVNMGKLYHNKNKCENNKDKALKYYRDALEKFKLSLPLDHPSIEEVYMLISDSQSVAVDNYDRNLIGQIFNQKYKVREKLGAGAYGSVFLVYDMINKNEKAMKIFNFTNENIRHTYFNEIDLLKRLNSELFVTYFDHFTENYLISFIITEYCQNGDLEKRIKITKTSGNKFSTFQILEWSVQATSALTLLHSNKIIHRDVKPSNIFLTNDDKIKLGDFGCARANESEKMVTTFIGTMAYRSPEFTKRSISYTYTTDIWSLGCVLFELITLEMAFPNGFEISQKLEFDKIKFLRSILEEMLNINWDKRIKSDELLNKLIEIKSKLTVAKSVESSLSNLKI